MSPRRAAAALSRRRAPASRSSSRRRRRRRPSRLARFSTRASTNSRSDRRFRYWRGSARTGSAALSATTARSARRATVRHTCAIAALRVPAGRMNSCSRGRVGVVVRQRFVEPRHRVGLQQLEAGDRQLAAEVEQLVLDHHQQLAHVVGQRLGQQHAELRVQLVDIAHRLHAQMVFGHARAVAQAGGAVVAGARGDLRQSLSPWPRW